MPVAPDVPHVTFRIALVMMKLGRMLPPPKKLRLHELNVFPLPEVSCNQGSARVDQDGAD
jgi:hypothetical protein